MELVVVVVGITAGVIALAGRIPDPRKVKRELASARVQTIESLTDGVAAAVRGTVAVVEPTAYVTTPWTQQRCVYWLVIFEEVGVGGDSRELGRMERGTPFLLRSEQGTARVVPDQPRIAIHGQSYLRPMHGADELLRVARGAKLKRPNYLTSWVRMTEHAVVPGTFVTIRGWVTREPDPEATTDVAGYRDQLPTRPVLSRNRSSRSTASRAASPLTSFVAPSSIRPRSARAIARAERDLTSSWRSWRLRLGVLAAISEADATRRYAIVSP